MYSNGELDHTFRLILITIWLVFLPVGIYHRIRSQATRERLDRRQEGLFILLTLRPAGVGVAYGLIAYLINPAWMAWSSMPLPEWLRWLGAGLAAAAVGLFFWTLRSLGKNLTDTVVTRREHTLVTHGPYRWIRHPFYDAAALFIASNALAAANWFILVCGAVMFVLLVIRTRKEEENLVARFGQSYRTYMAQTGRFLPRIGR